MSGLWVAELKDKCGDGGKEVKEWWQCVYPRTKWKRGILNSQSCVGMSAFFNFGAKRFSFLSAIEFLAVAATYPRASIHIYAYSLLNRLLSFTIHLGFSSLSRLYCLYHNEISGCPVFGCPYGKLYFSAVYTLWARKSSPAIATFALSYHLFSMCNAYFGSRHCYFRRRTFMVVMAPLPPLVAPLCQGECHPLPPNHLI